MNNQNNVGIVTTNSRMEFIDELTINLFVRLLSDYIPEDKKENFIE